jgi:cell division protein FtsB
MAYNDVKSALDAVSDAITAGKARYASFKESIEGIHTALDNLPTKYADEIAEINGYTPSDAAEENAQAELAKLQPLFVALRNKIAALMATDEWTA